ncbi:hypothetical protein ACWD5F_40430 [Streptomyces sp. NPDC002499]
MPYAPAQSEILDLYVPEGARKSVPVVVHMHGGGWGSADKSELTTLPEWECAAHRRGLPRGELPTDLGTPRVPAPAPAAVGTPQPRSRGRRPYP